MVAAFAQGKSAATGFKDAIFSIKGAVAAAATALGVGLSANALKNFIGGAMEAIDVNAKLSDRLGITTEALVGLQHAASLAGVSTDELTLGIQKMLNELPGGGTTEDAFKAIADQLRALPSAWERAKLAQEIFGRSGQRLIPLLLDGAEGIKAAQREAERLGITYNRIDAAKVEAANDAMTRMWAVLQGVAQTIAIQVSPFIDALATKLTNMAAAGGGLAPIILDGLEMVASGIANVVGLVDALKAAFYGFRASVLQVFADVQAEMAKMITAIGPKAAKALGLPSAASLRASARGLTQVAAEEAQKMNDAWGRFSSGAAAKQTKQWFDDIRKKADEAAKARAAAMAGLNTPGKGSSPAVVAPEAMEAAKSFTKVIAEEIASASQNFAAATEIRHSFKTPGGEKNNDAQLREAQKQTKQGDKTNALLDLIKQNLAKGDTVGVLSLN